MEYGAKSLVIGLDLGGTNSVFGIIDREGKVLTTTSIKTQGYMGIGAPGGNYYNGTIEQAANLAWAKGVVPLADMFANRLNIPVAITNDANAAAMGEMIYGEAVGMKNFVELTLGTGVGSGIVANGQLIYGWRAWSHGGRTRRQTMRMRQKRLLRDLLLSNRCGSHHCGNVGRINRAYIT